jgi:hypothetical protein
MELMKIVGIVLCVVALAGYGFYIWKKRQNKNK